MTRTRRTAADTATLRAPCSRCGVRAGVWCQVVGFPPWVGPATHRPAARLHMLRIYEALRRGYLPIAAEENAT